MGCRFSIGTCLGLFLVSTMRPPAAQAQPYTARDLGTLGGYYSFAYGINASGQVVGNSEIDFPPTPTHAFLWDEKEGMRDLGTLGGRNSYAFSINSAGQVVGCSNTMSGETHAFLWTRGGDDGVSINAEMKDLGTLSGGDSCAYGINDFGLIAGFSGFLYAERAVIWGTAGEIVDIAHGRATGINSLGQVAGAVTIRGTITDAFLWDPVTGLQDLGVVGGDYPQSWATSINEYGQVVGSSSTASRSHGFLYNGETDLVDLGTLGCDCFSDAFAINNSDQIVGDSVTLGEMQFAVLWDSQGQIHNLNDLIPAGSGWRLQEARAINDAGQIAAWGYHDGPGHAVLLSPPN